MNRIYCTTALLAAALLVFPTGLSAQAKKNTAVKPVGMRIKYTPPSSDKTLAVSFAKYDFIERVLRAHIVVGEDIWNKDVANTILGDVATEIPFKPSAPLDKRTKKELRLAAERKISKQFPKSLAQYKKELTEEAQRRFTHYSLRDNIRIRYRRGPHVYQVSGIYYSLSPDRRVVRIGSRVIPYIDVLPEDQEKIDIQVCEAKRADFVNIRYEDYRQRRRDAFMRAFNEIQDAQDNANEKAGYISFLDRWYTAEELTWQKINTERQKISAEARNGKDAAELLVFDTPDENALREKIKENKKNVAELSGVDSDQGYASAFWGFTRGEARLALKFDNFSPMATKEFDYFVTPNRQIRNVQFDYINNRLSRVIIFYMRVNFNDYEKLKEQYSAIYGEDDFKRAFPRDPRNRNRLRPHTWTGKTTVVHLSINFNEEEDIISGVTVVKEKVGAYNAKTTLVKELQKK